MKAASGKAGPGQVVAGMSLAALLVLSCGTDGGTADDGVTEKQSQLYLLGQTWPGGVVNVCYADDGNNQTLLGQARTILAQSWSAAANITFNGWGHCQILPEQKSWVVIHFAAGTNGNTSSYGRVPAWWCGFSWCPGITNMTLRSDDPDPYQAQFRYEVIHEFGHALGFAHEQERPDNWDPFDPNEDWLYCGATYQGRHGLSGGTYETPLFDYASIMDYCDSDPLGGFWRTTLSAGDITGVRNVYDRNPAAHGFMIQSDTNPGLAVSAAAGEGQPVQLRSDCTYRNPNCTWTYQYGMIVSDADPHYVIVPAGGVSDGNSLVLTQYCWTWEGQPGPPANQRGCTWTYRSGQFVNDLNTSLAMNAWGGARAGAGLVATSLCSPSNPDCTWTLPHVMFSSGQNSTLGMTASTIVNAGIMKIWDSCTPSSTNCTWKWTKGMLISDQNASLAVNAYGGAASGTVMRLSNACTATNQDCTWTWSHGELFSDNSRGGMVAAHPYGGAVYNAPLILDNGCDQTNPDCVFNSVFARDSW